LAFFSLLIDCVLLKEVKEEIQNDSISRRRRIKKKKIMLTTNKKNTVDKC